jgi:hypothetical protein
MIIKRSRQVLKALFPTWWERMRQARAARAERLHWNTRIADVVASPDNSRLSRVENAGHIVDGYQIMHNGLQVLVNGYYGDGITRMLAANRGSHEPQEEVVFEAITRALPSGAVMVEAGAYWGFYSMWFSQTVDDAKVYLIEPSSENLRIGEANFRRNHRTGDFTHAYIGAVPGKFEDGTPVITIESFLAEKGISHVALLHADIQGFELQMLDGAERLLATRSIDYLFISTHTMELHDQVAARLRESGYLVLVSVKLEESHSYDGLIVACSSAVTAPVLVSPVKKAPR